VLTASSLLNTPVSTALCSADARTLAVELWAALHGLALLRLNVPDFDWPAPLETMTDRVVRRLIQLNNTEE
jgi:hypothetical protein